MIKIVILIINIIITLIKYFIKFIDYDNMVISILKFISEYNIIFVKIFQWTWIKNNSNNVYITNEIAKELYLYTNKTPYDDNDINYKSLANIFITANKLEDKFELSQINPINSGSISLIFGGKLNGNDVIIKMLRKNIKTQVNKGIDLLVMFEKILKYIPWFKIIGTNNLFLKNKLNILNQTNFINESENIKLFYDNFKNNKNIVIPNVYLKYTNNDTNIIIMDLIEGKYLSELDSNELNDYFIYFLKFIINSIFVKNIFHSDLHQGNILFGKKITLSGKERLVIGIIDFGMIIKLDIDEINLAYLWFESVYNDKFLYLLDFIKNTENHKNIFENAIRINECVEYLKTMYNEKKIFNNYNFENFSNDIYLFLKILNQFECTLISKCHYYILSLIPIFSIIIKLGPDLKKRIIIKEELLKMTNSHLLD